MALLNGLLALACVGMASFCTVITPEHKIVTPGGYRWLAILGWLVAGGICLLNLNAGVPR